MIRIIVSFAPSFPVSEREGRRKDGKAQLFGLPPDAG
jgi:hypothetical protein